MLLCSTDHIYQLFERGALPTLLYITKQEHGKRWVDRPMHSHKDIAEINVVFFGKGIYYNELKRFLVGAGDVIVNNPRVPHELSILPEQENMGTYCLGLRGFRRPGLEEDQLIVPGDPVIRTGGYLHACLCELCEVLYRSIVHHDAGAPSAPMALAALLDMVLGLPPKPAADGPGSLEEMLAERVKSYIDAHFCESLTLEGIAAELHCSAPYISHTFKNVTGFSPIQYVTRCRIGLAQNYLISSDYTATQIAQMVGYGNTNYFSTVFRKTVGLTPIQYRHSFLKGLRGSRTQ